MYLCGVAYNKSYGIPVWPINYC